MTAELQMMAMVELFERKRIARKIALWSLSFSALIAIVPSILAIAA